jgi:hypothetical protein
MSQVAHPGKWKTVAPFLSSVFPFAQGSRGLNEDCLPPEVCAFVCMSASYYAEDNQNCQQNARKN